MPSKLSGGMINISFAYSPTLNELVKKVPGRVWDPYNKVWTLPATPWHAAELVRICGHVIGIGEDIKVLASKLTHGYTEPSDLEVLNPGMFKVGNDQPFPYQMGSIEFALDKKHRFINADSVGLGKTIEAIITARYYKHDRIFVICPASLTYKWQAALQHWYPELRDIKIIRTMKQPFSDYVNIMSYDIMRRCSDRFETMPVKPELVIFDECFPYDTLIDTSIGKLKIGDIVENNLEVEILSCNFLGDELQYNKVVRWIKKPAIELVKITHQFGEFICTPNHKIYVEGVGYVQAGNLNVGESLRVVRADLSSSSQLGNQQDQEVLFSELWIKSHSQSQTQGILGESGTSGENIQGSYRSTSTEILRTNDPNEQDPRVSSSNECGSSRILEGSNLPQSGREWEDLSASRDVIQPTWFGLVHGIRGEDEIHTENICRSSEALQDRYSQPVSENSNRGGREFSSISNSQGAGLSEKSSFIISRVDSIEIPKREDLERVGYGGERGEFVYNLEIESNHNYFANGVLVSNCHRLRNYKTKQFKTAKVLVKGVPHIQGLTGTPIINRPNELYNILNMLDPNAWTWVSFMERYCGSRDEGYQQVKNLPELEQRLKTIMIRRYKQDVMSQMPPVMHTKVQVDIDLKNYKRMYREDPNFMMQYRPSKPYFDNYLDWFQALRHHCEHAKIEAAIEYLEDFLQTSKEKIVIYCAYKDSVKILEQALWGYGVSIISGDVKQEDRFNIIYHWQNTHKNRVMLITSAGGEGIDLFGIGDVQCSTLVFVGREWSPMTEDQIVGRIDRMGQKFPCQVVYLVAQETIDVDIDKLIEGKRSVIKQTVGIYPSDTSVVSDLRTLHRHTFKFTKE